MTTRLCAYGLKAMFEKSDIRVIAEASDGNAAIKLAKKHRPNLALLDVRMPGGDGLSCLGRLKLDLPEIPVVMFSSFDNPTYIARAFCGTGRCRIHSKRHQPREDHQRDSGCSQRRFDLVERRFRRVTGALALPSVVSDSDVQLTKREGEVLKQLALGLTNKEIAQSLGISYETVKEHVQHILQKLAVTDRTQAAVWAVRRNLL